MKSLIIPFVCICSFLLGCTNSNTETQIASLNEEIKTLQGELVQLEKSRLLQKGDIKHTVIFSLKHALDAPETEKFLQDGKRILSALPMVNDFEVFHQVSIKNEYAFGFSMLFPNQEAYQAYNDHPDHVKFVKERWETEVIKFLEADFIVE
ncbi:Dabb family protein [Parabacteroides sp. OttesenSCG-928-G07]|nr:Dabb family protein [Parabacteroides sp. OttesenSCG-928-G07]